jgi:hypothetical protein
MATLTLKKPKYIGKTPLADLTGKFVVMRQARKESSFRFACYHDTEEQATKEAKRLFGEHQTERYLVLQVKTWVDGGV